MTRRTLAILAAIAALYAACLWTVTPDLPRLWAGLPRLARMAAGAFPPDFSDPLDLARRGGETVAIATLGTTPPPPSSPSPSASSPPAPSPPSRSSTTPPEPCSTSCAA